jgi:hypothetical protein
VVLNVCLGAGTDPAARPAAKSLCHGGGRLPAGAHRSFAGLLPGALEAQRSITLPVLLGNATMVAIFIFVVNKLTQERQTRAVKDRLESELRLAREIQLSLVPNRFPPFPDRPGFDVFAVLEQADDIAMLAVAYHGRRCPVKGAER